MKRAAMVAAATTLALVAGACERKDPDPAPQKPASAATNAAQAAELASAKAEAERARQVASAAEAERDNARKQAERERLKRLQGKAPSKVWTQQLGCYCERGGGTAVSCRVTNDSDLFVTVDVLYSARTGILGLNGQGRMAIKVPAHQNVVQTGITEHKTNAECTSATDCACNIVDHPHRSHAQQASQARSWWLRAAAGHQSGSTSSTG